MIPQPELEARISRALRKAFYHPTDIDALVRATRIACDDRRVARVVHAMVENTDEVSAAKFAASYCQRVLLKVHCPPCFSEQSGSTRSADILRRLLNLKLSKWEPNVHLATRDS